jgi:hypothetical protein
MLLVACYPFSLPIASSGEVEQKAKATMAKVFRLSSELAMVTVTLVGMQTIAVFPEP